LAIEKMKKTFIVKLSELELNPNHLANEKMTHHFVQSTMK